MASFKSLIKALAKETSQIAIQRLLEANFGGVLRTGQFSLPAPKIKPKRPPKG